ncbi:glycosyl hydrolase family 28 protein [Alicyclobacillus sp. SO9]|uniref:glycosyl hydrolase family 28 protein n=1 Tax=Alicyclobacillus sp. SO9 TaxID=2665646 RepID=UPI0018E8B8DF|nr:glycosyl hydrolase family 28 protein [Alicyclobacillus sp. SO9]QQE77922.1 hypothetical protein GI364_18700 [Alicyclobacillus sp. SO9]
MKGSNSHWKRRFSVVSVLAVSSGLTVMAGFPATGFAQTTQQSIANHRSNAPLQMPASLQTYAVTSSLIDLIWNPVYKSGVSYDVYQNGSLIGTVSKSNFTVQGLQPNHKYTFTVVAKDTLGNKSRPSRSLVVSTKPRGVTLNVQTFGTAGNGTTDDTAALQKAIDAVPAGGTVYIPAGTYLTAPLTLKSDMTLDLAKGAKLLGSSNIDQYKPVWSRWEGIEMYRYQSLLYGKNVKNVTITGQGTIDGNGETAITDNSGKTYGSWWARGKNGAPNYKEPTTNPAVNLVPQSSVDLSKGIPYARPGDIEFTHSKNVLIQGVTVQNSPSWTIHPLYSQNVTLADLDIENPPTSDNTDGVDPDSVTGMKIINNTFNVGDDDIAIKSGKDAQGRKIGIPASGIIIRNNLMKNGHGGVTIGSEMSGGVHNILARDDVFNGTKEGIRMKSLRGRGGTISDLVFEHISMYNIQDAAVHIDERYSSNGAPEAYTGKIDAGTPRIENILFQDITDNDDKHAMYFRGLTEMNIQHLIFKNVKITNAQEGIEASNVSDVQMDNVSIDNQKNPGFWFYQSTVENDLGKNVPSQFTDSEFGGFLHGDKLFNGSTTVSLPAGVLNSNQGSITSWVRPSKSGGTIMAGTNGNAGFSLQYTKQGKIDFVLTDGTTRVALESTHSYKPGHWRHVTAIWTPAGKDALYVNGRRVASAIVPLAKTSVSKTIVLGANTSGMSHFVGTMKEARIYNYAMSHPQTNFLFSQSTHMKWLNGFSEIGRWMSEFLDGSHL